MSSKWQANKIGLINFWYYDEQEFPFVKGRMLLRGSNGSGKSVTMQSVVPLLLDGNMSPERLDPFGSRDRKMSSYLLEENDGREERTGYLYLEFKRQDSENYLTIGMGMRARRGKPLDKWYFSLTDGRRVGDTFLLYKKTDEKVTLSKRELEYRIGDGGRVFERQIDYMEYVNRQIFGFETIEEYKEMIDLLIQLRTPKLSKDFKPSVINEILSDSLQPLSDEDLRPMSEAIENMDSMNMNLKSRKEAKKAGEKINAVFLKYNQKILYEKAERFEKVQSELVKDKELQRECREKQQLCKEAVNELELQSQQIDAKRESMEKERESLNKSDAVALKSRESQLNGELERHQKILAEKTSFLEMKQEQYRDTNAQLKQEENRRYEKEKELKNLLEEMQSEADDMSFEEHAFLSKDLLDDIEKPYRFSLHEKQLVSLRQQINEGTDLLAETVHLERQKDELTQKREKKIRELDASQRKVSEHENELIQARNDWKEAVYQWNGGNRELILDKDLLREMSKFSDSYDGGSDFATVREKVADVWIAKKTKLEAEVNSNRLEAEVMEKDLAEVREELNAWENEKEPQPFCSDATIRNRQRLEQMNIPYQEFYKVIEFHSSLDEKTCDRIEEALMQMGMLDAIVVDKQYKDQVLQFTEGCEDHYLFVGEPVKGQSLLGVLEINDEINDLFMNSRLVEILSSIGYDGESVVSITAEGTYRIGVMTGTVSGEHKAAFLGTKARENHRLAKIEECKNMIANLEEQLRKAEDECQSLNQRKECLNREYGLIPSDTVMRDTLKAMIEAEHLCDQLRGDVVVVEHELQGILNILKEKKKIVLEISKRLFLACSYETFKNARAAAESYSANFTRLQSVHEMLLHSIACLHDFQSRLESLDEDLDQIRYDIHTSEREIRRKEEERNSIQEQLRLTDYEEIKERLDQCISWLNQYPDEIRRCTREKTQKQDEVQNLEIKIEELNQKVNNLASQFDYFEECYHAELALNYVALPDGVQKDAMHVREYLEAQIKSVEKDAILNDINKVYFENKGFLTDYQLSQNKLFTELGQKQWSQSFPATRLDYTAQYQGVKVSFSSLLAHLEEDIVELENLIKDGDRELFEDILANTVSRKIRSKINASNMWVQKMNSLMNSMNTSSGLKLNLRWRSRTAEQEDQLDTKELVDLLRKDYRFMEEEEATRLSAHFRSKVEDARRHARDSAGMVSFYQIMKDTLDYRKWFEFQLFFQKNGERQKELTNSVFGTFSGGEKAMSMYVPLFSAVVAKYQGGREDAPKLISLDEAFAGVDNRNIRDMFRLMAEFQFDFIINSQVLWGDCDTLDALAIYQLIRPENAKFVTVMPYLWNGYSKELLEREDEVEQRGMEIE